MAKTKIGIVYGTKSKIVRRIIIPDDDSELKNPLHVGDGETMKLISINSKHDHKTLNKLIGTNPDPTASRCAVVHPSGDVVHVIMADPEIDRIDNHPGYAKHILVLHPTASVGWKYDHKTKEFKQ